MGNTFTCAGNSHINFHLKNFSLAFASSRASQRVFLCTFLVLNVNYLAKLEINLYSQVWIMEEVKIHRLTLQAIIPDFRREIQLFDARKKKYSSLEGKKKDNSKKFRMWLKNQQGKRFFKVSNCQVASWGIGFLQSWGFADGIFLRQWEEETTYTFTFKRCHGVTKESLFFYYSLYFSFSHYLQLLFETKHSKCKKRKINSGALPSKWEEWK